VSSGRSHADPEQVRAAAQLLLTAKRPLLLAGGGVVHAGATHEFRTLAERMRAPATGTQMAIGVVRTDDPSFIGHAGALGGRPGKRALEEAEVVVAVGCESRPGSRKERGRLLLDGQSRGSFTSTSIRRSSDAWSP